MIAPWDTILSTAAGAIAGAVASVIAPWANWGVEKRRDRLRERRAKIAQWREWVAHETSRGEITGDPIYGEIRPHLRASTVHMIETGNLTIVRGRGGSPIMNALIEDLNELEERWAPVDALHVIWGRRIGRVSLWYRRRRGQRLAERKAKEQAKISPTEKKSP